MKECNCKVSVRLLNQLFLNDTEEFMDNAKFEQIVNILPQLYLSQNQELVKEVIQTCVQLFVSLSDDYKRKTLNHALLQLIRENQDSNYALVLNLINTLLLILEKVNEQFVLFIQDLLPYLHDLLDHVNLEIEHAAKHFLIRLE